MSLLLEFCDVNKNKYKSRNARVFLHPSSTPSTQKGGLKCRKEILRNHKLHASNRKNHSPFKKSWKSLTTYYYTVVFNTGGLVLSYFISTFFMSRVKSILLNGYTFQCGCKFCRNKFLNHNIRECDLWVCVKKKKREIPGNFVSVIRPLVGSTPRMIPKY